MLVMPIATRQAWFATLARASAGAIEGLLSGAPALPDFEFLRRPEAGMAMVRGRLGGDGAAFNLGEMTMARASIRDAAGRIGHGYAAGRDLAQVVCVARLDAVLQDADLFDIYEAAVLAPLRAQQAAARAVVETKAAATEVKFFTMSVMR